MGSVNAMKISVLHDCRNIAGNPDEHDTYVQAEKVAESLKNLGMSPHIHLYNGNSEELKAILSAEDIDLVFNLVENFSTGNFRPEAVPTLFEYQRMPFTGSGSQAVMKTTDKIVAKQEMRKFGIPTADWVDVENGFIGKDISGKYIIKPVSEDASVGINSDSVVDVSDIKEIVALLKSISSKEGKRYFGEKYIDGREFNISLLSSSAGVEILPVAELLFQDWDQAPKILDYDAKWDSASNAYSNVVRRYDFRVGDARIVERLSGIARECWEIFSLKGYARVDFRVDENGEPWVLEVNTNPCLSPDAGFYAAAVKRNITFDDVIRRITKDALLCFENKITEKIMQR